MKNLDREIIINYVSSLIATREKIWKEELEKKIKDLPKKHMGGFAGDWWAVNYQNLVAIIQDKKQK